jgi:uncharacterized protein (TIGR02271 family)
LEEKALSKKGDRAGNPEEQHQDESRVIPVIREEVTIGKRTVETGVTRVRKTVSEREETIDLPLSTEEVQVERVPVNRFIEAPEEIRQEGETTVIPVMEEVVVVEKRIRLKEEIRIKKVAKTVHHPEQVTVRSEEAAVEHEDAPGRGGGSGRSES